MQVETEVCAQACSLCAVSSEDAEAAVCTPLQVCGGSNHVKGWVLRRTSPPLRLGPMSCASCGAAAHANSVYQRLALYGEAVKYSADERCLTPCR